MEQDNLSHDLVVHKVLSLGVHTWQLLYIHFTSLSFHCCIDLRDGVLRKG